MAVKSLKTLKGYMVGMLPDHKLSLVRGDAPRSIMRTGAAGGPLKSRYVALSPRILRESICGANHGRRTQESVLNRTVRGRPLRLTTPFHAFLRFAGESVGRIGETAYRSIGARPRFGGRLQIRRRKIFLRAAKKSAAVCRRAATAMGFAAGRGKMHFEVGSLNC